MNHPSPTSQRHPIAITIASLILPILLGYLGYVYQQIQTKEDIHEKYVSMAVRILQEPANADNTELRQWAIDILHHYSEVPLSQSVQQHLRQSSLPQNHHP